MHGSMGHNRPPPSVAAGIREAILHNRVASAKDFPKDPHGFRVDRLTCDYLDGHPKWGRKVALYLEELKSAGERVVYADICGRTTGPAWGVDIGYCFSLQASDFMRRMRPDHYVVVDGDIFRMRDFYSFLALMRDKGDRPAFVTFYPLAGLQSYLPWELESSRETRLHPQVTWQRLANNLKKLLEVMRPGGYIYLGRPFSLCDPDMGDWFARKEYKDHTSVKWMQAFCKGKRCSVEFKRTIVGMEFLLRKWKDRSR